MAKISDGSFKDWQDTQTVNAAEYKRERELLRVANNDNYDRISSLEEVTSALGLDRVQISKITNDEGGVKLTTTSTEDDILAIILAAGKGFHTFYAVGGSKNLPPTNISIRGIAHFTDSGIGWVYATDYRNNIYTNYYDAGGWDGWNKISSGLTNAADDVKINVNSTSGDILASVRAAGVGVHSFYATFGSKNLPNPDRTHRGLAQVLSDGTAFVLAITNDNQFYTNYYESTWKGWNRLVSAQDEQLELWSGAAYPVDGATLTPTKKLSQCRNGWIIVWSDYDSGVGANNYDIAYSYIPKSTAFKNGHLHVFSVPTFATGTTAQVVVKKLYVYDNKVMGHDDNGSNSTNTSDAVIRQILEW